VSVAVLAIVAVSAGGLAICLTIVCVGLLCLRSPSSNIHGGAKNGTLSQNVVAVLVPVISPSADRFSKFFYHETRK